MTTKNLEYEKPAIIEEGRITVRAGSTGGATHQVGMPPAENGKKVYFPPSEQENPKRGR